MSCPLRLGVREWGDGGPYLGSGAGAGKKPGAPSRLHVRWSGDGRTQHLRCGTAQITHCLNTMKLQKRVCVCGGGLCKEIIQKCIKKIKMAAF